MTSYSCKAFGQRTQSASEGISANLAKRQLGTPADLSGPRTLESARAGLWRRNNDENLSIRHTNGRKVTCACKTCKCIQVFTNPNECCEYEDSLMWYSWVQVFIERIKYHQVTVQKNWPNGWINSSVYSRNKWNILQYLQQRVGYQLWAMLLCAYFYFLWMKTVKWATLAINAVMELKCSTMDSDQKAYWLPLNFLFYIFIAHCDW